MNIKKNLVFFLLCSFVFFITGCSSEPQSVNLNNQNSTITQNNLSEELQKNETEIVELAPTPTFKNRISGVWISENDEYFKLTDNGSIIYYDNKIEPNFYFYGIANIYRGDSVLNEIEIEESLLVGENHNIDDVYLIDVSLEGAYAKNKIYTKEELSNNIKLIAIFVDNTEELKDKVLSVYFTNKNEITTFFKIDEIQP